MVIFNEVISRTISKKMVTSTTSISADLKKFSKLDIMITLAPENKIKMRHSNIKLEYLQIKILIRRIIKKLKS
jgi:hypothetical protein